MARLEQLPTCQWNAELGVADCALLGEVAMLGALRQLLKEKPKAGQNRIKAVLTDWAARMQLPVPVSDFVRAATPFVEWNLRVASIAGLGQSKELTEVTSGAPMLYEILVNGTRVPPDDAQVAALRTRAVHGDFDIFADDVHGVLLLRGVGCEAKRSVLQIGQSLAWQTLLVLPEQVSGYWLYKDLYERVKRKPCGGGGDVRKAYQWVRHLKEAIDEAQKVWNLQETLNVDEWLDTGRAAGRVYVSHDVSTCIIRQATN